MPASLSPVVFKSTTDDILLCQGEQVTHIDTNQQEHQQEHVDQLITTSFEDRADFLNGQISLFRCLKPHTVPAERVVFRLLIIYRKVEDSSDTVSTCWLSTASFSRGRQEEPSPSAL